METPRGGGEGWGQSDWATAGSHLSDICNTSRLSQTMCAQILLRLLGSKQERNYLPHLTGEQTETPEVRGLG